MAMELGCGLCFHVNPQGVMECENCGEKLSSETLKEYFVKCMECKNDVILKKSDEVEFYCEECGLSYPIDGLNHRIQVRDIIVQESLNTDFSSISNTNELILEERISNHRIHIGVEGVLGRYGDFEPEFFQENNMLMVSGEHLIVSHDNGDWYVEHIGRNSTKLDGMELERGLKFILKRDQVLRMANVSFKVIIGS